MNFPRDQWSYLSTNLTPNFPRLVTHYWLWCFNVLLTGLRAKEHGERSQQSVVRDGPLPSPVVPTATAVSGPLTVVLSTPPPSPPGRWWNPQRRSAAGSLPSDDTSPAASIGCFSACPHSAMKDTNRHKTAPCSMRRQEMIGSKLASWQVDD